ncbi:MAG TPA: hypothetical protein VFR47_17840 [Anaerolineales bacterium]|nr:hypothetical protein [Anaerolineales bacterium]
MVHVLVLAENSLLADLIVSSLAQETSLEVFRLTQPDPGRVLQAIRERSPVVILVEEGRQEAFLPDNDLFEDSGCFRLITVSPHRDHVRIVDSYELPLIGMAQVNDLVRDFNREHWQEVIG